MGVKIKITTSVARKEDVKETGKCQTGIVIFLGSLRTGKI